MKVSLFSPEQPGKFCYDCPKVSKVSGWGIFSIQCHTELFSINMGAHTQKGTMLCPMIILHKIQKIDVQHTSLPVSVVCPGSKTESMIVGSPFALDLLALCFLKCGLGYQQHWP